MGRPSWSLIEVTATRLLFTVAINRDCRFEGIDAEMMAARRDEQMTN